MELFYVKEPNHNIRLEIGEASFFLHDMESPWMQCEEILSQLRERLDGIEHVLFYGVGIGYLVKLFTDYFPNIKITIYEPIERIYHLFNEMQNHFQINRKMIMKQYAGNTTQQVIQNLKDFEPYISDKILIVRLPSYQFLENSYQQFWQLFSQIQKEKLTNDSVLQRYSKLWIRNRLKLEQEIGQSLQFIETYKPYIKDKPVLLVAAGPSLNYELDNLKKIKKEKSAYIFAVGSANKTLVKHDIWPDAIFSYDPQQHNQFVISDKIKESMNIPLVYGTTVGYETVLNYKGDKFYFVTQRDKLTSYLYNRTFPLIQDASTISNITLQILALLEPAHIILVGVNFALHNRHFYAEGISRLKYNEGKNVEVGALAFEHELERSFVVKAVDNSEVFTTQQFEFMRKEMEGYIHTLPIKKITNTTFKGAKIQGADYCSLATIIEQELYEKDIVQKPVRKTSLNRYVSNKEFAHQVLVMEKQMIEFSKIVKENRRFQSVGNSEVILKKIQHYFHAFITNCITKSVLLPTLELEQKELLKEMQFIYDKIITPIEKVEQLCQVYDRFLNHCFEICELVKNEVKF